MLLHILERHKRGELLRGLVEEMTDTSLENPPTGEISMVS